LQHDEPLVIPKTPVLESLIASTTSLRVRYAETDQMGVVYHATYLVWLEVARTDLIRAHGITYAEIERRGYGLAVAELTIRYRAPAHYDEEVVVTAKLREVRSRSLGIDYEVTRVSDQTLLATAYTALVSIDAKTEKPVVLPPEIRGLFAAQASA
jgi:acyl-CoA thioester hydrolase